MNHNTPNRDIEAGVVTSGGRVEGLRFNHGKLRYDLVHPTAHEGMVKVLTAGAKKYADRNWEKGMSWGTVLASLKRHVAAFESGEDLDPETGLLHVDHIQCNAHFLSAYYKIAPRFDDRRHEYLKSVKIGLDIDGVLGDFITHLFLEIGILSPSITHWNDPCVRIAFDKIKKSPKFWLTMPILTRPEDIPFEPHCYVTSRSIDNGVTQQWLNENNFPAATLVSVGHNESKVDALKQLGVDVYVDDRFENFRELNDAGIFCYLFDAPHNQKYNVGHKRIKSLSQLA